MESVIEATEEFQEIPELLRRYETLSSTYQHLIQQQNHLQNALQSIKDRLHVYLHDKADEIIFQNNQLSQLKSAIEVDQLESFAQQSRRDAQRSFVSQKTLEFGQLILATDNLFRRCCANSVIAHATTLCPLEQLEVIGHFVSDLEAAVKAHKDNF